MKDEPRGDTVSDGVPWLVFDAGTARLGVPASAIEEIMPLGVVTPIPLAPPAISGLMGLRGEALPLLDLSAFFGLDTTGPSRTVLACRTSAYRVGLLCHRVRGIRNIASQQHCVPRLAAPARLRELAQAEVEEDDGLSVLLDIHAVLETARVRG